MSLVPYILIKISNVTFLGNMYEKFPALNSYYLFIHLPNISWSPSKAMENRLSTVFTFENITKYTDIKYTYLQQRYSGQSDREQQGLKKIVAELCADYIQAGI